MAQVVDSQSTPDMWEEFKRLICKLYELYGGNCADLQWPEEGLAGVSTVEGEFDIHGLPSFPNPAAEQQFRDDLDALEAVCQSEAQPPSAAAKAVGLAMISGMRDALNGTT